jgi:hypothetical protein
MGVSPRFVGAAPRSVGLKDGQWARMTVVIIA